MRALKLCAYKELGEVPRSRLKRDGLASGTKAPEFRLPRLEGGDLSLSEYERQRVLLVFSDPQCRPCDDLAASLAQLSRRTPDVKVIMVSRGDMQANRDKVKEHRLTFPVVLQRSWEVSRLYAMFATPIAYLINKDGLIEGSVAVGSDAILLLLRAAAISALLND